MAAVLSSCSKSELESATANESKDIVLNISVSDPGASDTKALIKTGWAEGDEISIWYDENTQATPDLVIKYDETNDKWTQDGAAVVIPTSASGKVKAVYSDKVIVASVDGYTLSGSTLTFSIENWKFLTEIQVVVYGDGIDCNNPSKYTLSCDKFTPCTGYSVGTDKITAVNDTEGTAVTGISNDGAKDKPGVAFVFATAEYSSTAANYKFTLTDNTSGSAVTREYTATTDKISGTTGSMAAIKALTIASSNFVVPVNPLYVEIAAKYDGSNITTLKWYRQNLAITESGKKAWKGNNTSTTTVTVPGTDKDVIVGDYFQWAAHANYSPTSQSQDKGLLLYTSFDNTKCGDANDKFYTDGGNFSKSFNMSNAPYGGASYTKYTSGSINLEKGDDVANIILGDNWRMPTSAELRAMREATYWAWDATDCGYYVFMPGLGTSGAANGRGNFNISTDDKYKALLFFPAAGYGTNTSLINAGSYGNYWSSTLYTSYTNYAYSLNFDSSNVNPQYNNYRYLGFSVRPVSD